MWMLMTFLFVSISFKSAFIQEKNQLTIKTLKRKGLYSYTAVFVSKWKSILSFKQSKF